MERIRFNWVELRKDFFSSGSQSGNMGFGSHQLCSSDASIGRAQAAFRVRAQRTAKVGSVSSSYLQALQLHWLALGFLLLIEWIQELSAMLSENIPFE